MKIVVIGGTGLIGSRLVELLRERGHEVVAASPQTGVNTLTGEGLAEALAGAQVVVDVANSPSFEDRSRWTSSSAGRNLLAAEEAAGVQHHVALSVVGAQRVVDSGYMRAKAAQENLIKASSIPYTISAIDAVLRVHRTDRHVGPRRRRLSCVAGAGAAGRVGRRCRSAGRYRARPAAQRDGRSGRSRGDPARRTGATGSRCPPGSPSDRGGYACPLLRRGAERPVAHPGSQRAHRFDDVRRLAPAIHHRGLSHQTRRTQSWKGPPT